MWLARGGVPLRKARAWQLATRPPDSSRTFQEALAVQLGQDGGPLKAGQRPDGGRPRLVGLALF